MCFQTDALRGRPTLSLRGAKRRSNLIGGTGIWNCFKMVSGDILGVGAPLAPPSFRSVRKQPLEDAHHFPAEFLVSRQSHLACLFQAGDTPAPSFLARDCHPFADALVSAARVNYLSRILFNVSSAQGDPNLPLSKQNRPAPA